MVLKIRGQDICLRSYLLEMPVGGGSFLKCGGGKKKLNLAQK